MAFTKASFENLQKSKKLKKVLLFPYLFTFLKLMVSSFLFFVLLNFYFLPSVFIYIQKLLRFPKKFVEKQEKFVKGPCKRVVNSFDKHNQISKWQLIDLAFKNMFAKKTRTAVTIGGMAIGIGATVFLLSIGYGTEQLVKNRVASLNEIRQADVSTVDQTQLPLNNDFLNQVLGIEGVYDVLPLVSVVGKVDYLGSAVDVVVYGATESYLEQSDVYPIKGEFYKSGNDWQKEFENPQITSYLLNSQVAQLQQNINQPQVSTSGNFVLGIEDTNEALAQGTTETTASIQQNIEDTAVQVNQNLEALLFDEEIDFEDPEIYSLIPEIAVEEEQGELQISLIESESVRQAVVTEAFLSAIGVTAEEAIDKTFNIQFTVVGDLVPELEGRKVTTKPATYSITSVINGDKPFVYVPIVDLKTLGVKNYSQAKVITKSEELIPKIREQIESFGFETQSVQDTLERIESLFGGLRVALLFLGTLALSVAALGMFNTLTVSLLERTHEVGLLKSLGMKSTEVKEMFLAESLILGFFGGVVGVLFGYLAGKTLDLGLTAFALSSGIGALSVTYIPFFLVLFVLILSFFIGVVTGFYPSKRATKISALDALRYE